MLYIQFDVKLNFVQSVKSFCHIIMHCIIMLSFFPTDGRNRNGEEDSWTDIVTRTPPEWKTDTCDSSDSESDDSSSPFSDVSSNTSSSTSESYVDCENGDSVPSGKSLQKSEQLLQRVGIESILSFSMFQEFETVTHFYYVKKDA